MGIAVLDRYARADSTTSLGTTESGHAWQSLTSGAAWGLTSSKAYLATPVSQSIAVVNSQANLCRVSADLTFSSGRADTGLVCNVVDDNNYILAAITMNSTYNGIQLYKRIGGTFTTIGPALASNAFTLGMTIRPELSWNGVTWNVLLGGTLLNAYTPTGAEITALGAATKQGIRVHYTNPGPGGDDAGTRFANFAVLAGGYQYGVTY